VGQSNTRWEDHRVLRTRQKGPRKAEIALRLSVSWYPPLVVQEKMILAQKMCRTPQQEPLF
jgi:hypothetical protein